MCNGVASSVQDDRQQARWGMPDNMFRNSSGVTVALEGRMRHHMTDALIRLEQTGFATWVRESPSLWAYPTVLFLHTVGLGFLVGINVAIDFRLLGIARELPLAPMERLFPYMWAGFWVNALSGTALLIADASTKLTNPVFYVKMIFVVLGVLNMAFLKRALFGDRPTPGWSARWIAISSLIVWTGATTAGRLMGYLGPKSGLE
jgi:hypothetical protein